MFHTYYRKGRLRRPERFLRKFLTFLPQDKETMACKHVWSLSKIGYSNVKVNLYQSDGRR